MTLQGTSFLALKSGVFIDQHLVTGEGGLCLAQVNLMVISLENFTEIYVTGSKEIRSNCQNNHNLKYKPSITCSVMPPSLTEQGYLKSQTEFTFSQLTSVLLPLDLMHLGQFSSFNLTDNPTKLAIKVLEKMLMDLI